MSQRRFRERNERSWKQLEGLLDAIEDKGKGAREEELPRLLRHVSEDLALAQHRRYASGLVTRLNALAQRAHTQLYRAHLGARSRLWNLLARDFPRAVRADAFVLVLGAVLLFGIGITVAIANQFWPELAYVIVGAEQLQQMETMHDPAQRASRSAGQELLMFGFYVEHNVSIAFYSYALGILFGLGTLYLLVYNGLVLGAVFGHMRTVGLGPSLEAFAIAHGAFELTGIMLCGTAGLKLGMALLAPGQLTRRAAIVAAARAGMPIVVGATVMLVVAALLESSWSPLPSVDKPTKLWVGGACWAAVIAFLALAGRSRR